MPGLVEDFELDAVLKHRAKRLINHYKLDASLVQEELKDLRQKLDQGEVELASVFANGLIGYGFISHVASLKMNKQAGELFGLWVSEDFRRLGVGEMLVRVRLGQAKFKPLTVIAEDNKASQALYSKVGFVKTSAFHPVQDYRWWELA